MATNSNTIAAALEAYKAEHLDGNFTATPLLSHWDRVGGIKKTSGRSLSCNLMLDEVSTGIDLVTGGEQLTLSSVRPFATATFQWARRAYPIILTGKDKDETSGEQGLFDLAQAYLENAHESAMRELNLKIIANTGGDSIYKDLASFYGTSTDGQATGIFEELAFGSQTNVVGGVNKASWVDSFQHQREDVADSWSTNGRTALNKIIRNCRHHTVGGGLPDLILMSDDGFANFEGGLDANERYGDAGKVRSTGTVELMIKGIPVAYEPGMPTSTVADELFTAYVLNLRKSLTLHHTPKGWFSLTPWQDMLAGQIDGEGCNLVMDVAVGVSHLPSVGVIVDGDQLS